MAKLGNNVEYSVDKDVLTIKINLKERLGKSASGKNTIVASTGGNQTVEGGYKVGVNVFVKE